MPSQFFLTPVHPFRPVFDPELAAVRKVRADSDWRRLARTELDCRQRHAPSSAMQVPAVERLREAEVGSTRRL